MEKSAPLLHAPKKCRCIIRRFELLIVIRLLRKLEYERTAFQVVHPFCHWIVACWAIASFFAGGTVLRCAVLRNGRRMVCLHVGNAVVTLKNYFAVRKLVVDNCVLSCGVLDARGSHGARL